MPESPISDLFAVAVPILVRLSVLNFGETTTMEEEYLSQGECYAGFWSRFAAWWLDAAISFGVANVIAGVARPC